MTVCHLRMIGRLTHHSDVTPSSRSRRTTPPRSTRAARCGAGGARPRGGSASAMTMAEEASAEVHSR